MAGPRYIADPPDSLVKVELDGLSACYHRPSGMTHILAPPAPQILAALAGAPGDEAVIRARLAARFEVEDIGGVLAARLAELEAAGLVRRA